MNSKWQANKIGLINFWYYDEQEFPFVKGRMLLRGSNGSGKSVTMQSVVPLLLDGNLSPERLDPFGSRDRKMSTYLLEEDDEREERTGYLYLEWKREDSQTYLTTGMGIRARRGKPLDKWYFGLSDGRRIGEDFYLYKEMGDRMPLSKKELENRIAGGGLVLDRQQDYMDYVNRTIFGFETVDEYKELIDLLIQLRTPKLSKDFKPSVINEILSNSLLPLTDDDLRPMSEAIENMDAMNMNLKSRKEAKQAGEKIYRELSKYNRLMLYKKAKNYCDFGKAQDRLLQEEKERSKTLGRLEKNVQSLQEEILKLHAKKEAMEKERETLGKSDAATLKKSESRITAQIEEQEQQEKKKNCQLQEKQEQQITVQDRIARQENSIYEKEKELRDDLQEMLSEAELFGFAEAEFLQKELGENLEHPYHFAPHRTLLNRTRQMLQKGTDLLRELDIQKRQVEALLTDRGRQIRERDAVQRRSNELAQLMTQTIGEWTEAFFKWNTDNTLLKLSGEITQLICGKMQDYHEQFDFGEIRTLAADERLKLQGDLRARQKEVQEEHRKLTTTKEEVESQLAQWENAQDPQPERTEATLKNRARLDEKKIPYYPLYQVLEFEEELDANTRDHLEEAMLQMGILDALIIDECYKEEVLAMDPGSADRYLFFGKGTAEKSLLDLFTINDQVNDIFFNQKVNTILQRISWGGSGETAIAPDGRWQIGVLTGTITGEHKAGFLGTKAREENRQRQIAACKKQLEELLQKLAQKERELSKIAQDLEILQKEYETLPTDQGIRIVQRELTDCQKEEQLVNKAVERLENEIRKKRAAMEEAQKEAVSLADQLYLNCDYAIFAQAKQAEENYEQYLYRVESGHQVYLSLVDYRKHLQERSEELDQDEEQIRYDLGMITRRLRKDREELSSVREQLALTDYEEVKERLDVCIAWLDAFPEVLSEKVQNKAKAEENIVYLTEQKEHAAAQIRRNEEQIVWLKNSFEQERDLRYVEISETDGVEQIVSDLAIAVEGLDETSVIASLNQVFMEHRGALAEHQLTQTELFADSPEAMEKGYPSAKRFDILARYQGNRISFQNLLLKLQEDIEELQELIKDGDRELFEDILANTVSRKIRNKINASNAWVRKMNQLMNAMNTSSGLRLSLRWRAKVAETEEQLDTRDLVELLKKDYRVMREEEADRLSRHFRSKVEQARRNSQGSGGTISFYQTMKETLDYRKWFEFQLFFQKTGERVKELTNSAFGTFSGGEKAMSMYVPLFSAVTAKYEGGSPAAPRMISLDEAFAGVDNQNIRDMFRLMGEFQFNFIINSQVLWGDCDTLDALAIYQLIRPENVKFVTVMSYLWNGNAREMLEDEREMASRAAKL